MSRRRGVGEGMTCWCCGDYLKPKTFGPILAFSPCRCCWTDRCLTLGQCKDHCRCGNCTVVTSKEYIASRTGNTKTEATS